MHTSTVNHNQFSMSIHQNPMHISQNTHLQTLYENLQRTRSYSNLTEPDLWGITDLVFGGVTFQFWIKKRGA